MSPELRRAHQAYAIMIAKMKQLETSAETMATQYHWRREKGLFVARQGSPFDPTEYDCKAMEYALDLKREWDLMRVLDDRAVGELMEVAAEVQDAFGRTSPRGE